MPQCQCQGTREPNLKPAAGDNSALKARGSAARLTHWPRQPRAGLPAAESHEPG